MNQTTFPFKVLPITRDVEPPRPEIRELSTEEARKELDRVLELSGRSPTPPDSR